MGMSDPGMSDPLGPSKHEQLRSLAEQYADACTKIIGGELMLGFDGWRDKRFIEMFGRRVHELRKAEEMARAKAAKFDAVLEIAAAVGTHRA